MSNLPPRNSRIYLDTWFLLRVFIDDFDRVKKKKVKQVLAELLIRKCLLVTSPLSFLEMVKVVNDKKKHDKVGNKLIRKINSLLKGKIVIGLTGLKYSDMRVDIKSLLSAMEKLSNSGSFQVLESKNPLNLVMETFSNLSEGNILKPADSFHYSYALANACDYIVTGDKDFIKKVTNLGALDVLNMNEVS